MLSGIYIRIRSGCLQPSALQEPEDAHTACFQEFTYEFGQAVFNRLRSRSRKMLQNFVHGLKSINAEFGFDPVSGLPTFSLGLGDISRPEYTLTEIFQCLEQADRPCIVTFDEFQQIGKYNEKNIEALLRSHIQHLGNVNFIFSGSETHMLSQMFMSSARPFYHSASMLELKPIDPEKYSEFVIRHFEKGKKKIAPEAVMKGKKRIAPEAVGKVYGLFEGNTYCMQKTFHEAYATVPEGGECTVGILRETVDSIIEEASVGYRMMLSDIPLRQKELRSRGCPCPKDNGGGFPPPSLSRLQQCSADCGGQADKYGTAGSQGRSVLCPGYSSENVPAAADESSEGIFPGRMIRRWYSCRGRGR